jgi:hypothetical protein
MNDAASMGEEIAAITRTVQTGQEVTASVLPSFVSISK